MRLIFGVQVAALWFSMLASPAYADFRPNERIAGQESKTSPALAVFRDRLHMVHLGTSSNDIWHSVFDGTTWRKLDGTPGNSRIPGQESKASPALAVFRDRLHMVHLGTSSNDIWHSVFDGTTWRKLDGTPGNSRIAGQESKAAPALAVFRDRLHMVHLGTSSNDIWHSVFDGTTWRKLDGTPGNSRIPGQESKASPALAVFRDRLHMVHLGTSSNDIWHSVFDGTTWRRLDGTPGNSRIPGQESRAAPALAVFQDRLHMVHLGTSSNDIWHSVFDGTTWRKPNLELGNDKIPEQRSKDSPALSAFGSRLHMVHLGESSNDIWWSQFDWAYVFPRCTLDTQITFNQPRIVATASRNCVGIDPPKGQLTLRVRRHVPILADDVLKTERAQNVDDLPMPAIHECRSTATDFPSTAGHLDGAGAANYYADLDDGKDTVESPRITIFDC